MTCPLCDEDGGVAVWRGDKLRVIRVDDTPAFPAFYRVVWNAHVAEFSELPAGDRHLVMDAVAAVERVLRDKLSPTKVNLAALGNMVPHLHWHVVARFAEDSHFPSPIWAAAQREAPVALLRHLNDGLPALDAAIAEALHA